jgi:hypothetical protein
MAKRNEKRTRNAERSESESEPEVPKTAPEPAVTAPRVEAIPRLNLPLTDDGAKIDWERVRPSNREKFTSLIASDPVARAILVPTGDGESEADPFGGITTENIRAGLNILSQVESLAFSVAFAKFKKHPFKKLPNQQPAPFVIEPDVLQACFTLTEEQHQELDPRALRIAQKHAGGMPQWLQKNLDLYMLIGMYLRYTAANAANAIKTQTLRDVAAAMEVQRKRAVSGGVAAQPGDADRAPKQKVNGRDITPHVESFEPGHIPEGTEMPPSDIERP